MARQVLIPGYVGYDETGTRQVLVPGYAGYDETSGATSAPFVSSYQNQVQWPLWQAAVDVLPSLLLTTLAVVVVVDLPVGQQALAAQSQHPSHVRHLSETSAGTPKGLYADAQLPFDVLVQTAPDRLRPVTDTSQKQPITLQAIILPAPLTEPPHFAPTRFFWQPQDTSAGTPKALYLDAQLPFDVLAQTAPDRLRPVTDTSRGQPITLQAIVPPPPFVVAPHFPPYRFWWQPLDASAGTAKVLYGDAQLPFVVLPQSALDRAPTVVDSSRQSNVIFYPPTPVPPIIVVPGSGGGGGIGGGKRHLPCLDDLDVFKKLECRKPGQTILEALKELDEPEEIAAAQEVLKEAKAVVRALPQTKHLKVELKALQQEIAALQAFLREQERLLKQQEQDDEDDDDLLLSLL